jgi:hypothetical protein
MGGVLRLFVLLKLKGGSYGEVRLLTADGVFAMPEV